MTSTPQYSELVSLALEGIAEVDRVALPPQMARLYSQNALIRSGRSGLESWSDQLSEDLLNSAARLVELSFLLGTDHQSESRTAMRRAGEIMEWLAPVVESTNRNYLFELSAACYQIAGYPARAMGVLNRMPESAAGHQMIAELLRGRIQNSFEACVSYYENGSGVSDDPAEQYFHQFVSALALVCAGVRWGEDERTRAAVDKLHVFDELLLHAPDPLVWLLYRLLTKTVETQQATGLRRILPSLRGSEFGVGSELLERFIRRKYLAGSHTAWPSQIDGINRLREPGSFAVCTPTGSGKTAIAELAILQGLFGQPADDSVFDNFGPIVLYLVPSRALAMETEQHLEAILSGLSDTSVIQITGLYGGADWGPSDFWLTTEQPTVLICTWEKADALVRFVGNLITRRITTVVVDEVHTVQSRGNVARDERSLRLESLIARLKRIFGNRDVRFIGLSAVARGYQGKLSNWLHSGSESTPVTGNYRSTRQMLGRLLCRPGGRFEIRYDSMDGRTLVFEGAELGRDTPWIPQPFSDIPTYDEAEFQGPQKRLRPYMFWAAINLASKRDDETQSVLVFVPEHIVPITNSLVNLLEGDWSTVQIPNLLNLRTDPKSVSLWERTVSGFADYFGQDSDNYRLLMKGIAVHHGAMPGRLGHLIVECVREKIIPLVFATSTLSEGVNMPFQTVLLQSLTRFNEPIDIREIANLIGRAGRPGIGPEGVALFITPDPIPPREASNIAARQRYDDLLKFLRTDDDDADIAEDPKSSLAFLLSSIERGWQSVTQSDDSTEFEQWLEIISPSEELAGDETEDMDKDALELLTNVDQLDSILLASIVESGSDSDAVEANEIEKILTDFWAKTYARVASERTADFEKIVTLRGKAIVKNVLPESAKRRAYYKTGLRPFSAKQFLEIHAELEQISQSATDYESWDAAEKLDWVLRMTDSVRKVPEFSLSRYRGLGSGVDYKDVLGWWLDPINSIRSPEPHRVAHWHKFINDAYRYRLNWGIGSFLIMVYENLHPDQLVAASLEDWDSTGLPWVVLWLKDMFSWGTLDPVAAYCLTQRIADSRSEAEQKATEYRSTLTPTDDPLDPRVMKEWARLRDSGEGRTVDLGVPRVIGVNSLIDTSSAPSRIRVVPTSGGIGIRWRDLAGRVYAESEEPIGWKSGFINSHDFFFESQSSRVISSAYLS